MFYRELQEELYGLLLRCVRFSWGVIGSRFVFERALYEKLQRVLLGFVGNHMESYRELCLDP